MNNLDTSSNGVTLELNVQRDIHISQHNFEENFKRLDNDQFLFIDHGNFQSDFDLADIENYNFTKADLLNGLYDHDDDIQALKDSFLWYTGNYIYKASKQELIDYIEYTLYSEEAIIKFYNEYLTPKFETVTVTGYCQGDHYEVIFPHESLKEYTFEDKDQFLNLMQDYFENLFFNAPVYLGFTVDNEDHKLEYELKNEYEYDKEEVLKIAQDIIDHEKITYILEWLSENLPDTCDYK